MDLQRYLDKKLSDEKSDLELKLNSCSHRMELIRTIIPILVLVVQIIILVKIS